MGRRTEKTETTLVNQQPHTVSFCAPLVRPKIAVLPHVPVAGGAGLYIRALLDELRSTSTLTLVGAHASAFADFGNQAELCHVRMPVLPAYEGASLKAFAAHMIMWPHRALAIYIEARRCRTEWLKFDALLTTSVIDLSSLFLIKLAAPHLKTFGIVQENAFLSGFRGLVNRAFIKRLDGVVSISRRWSEKLLEAGIASDVVPNPFNDMCRRYYRPVTPVFDLIYVGGDARNKGFRLFTRIIEALSARRQIRVAILGQIGASAATALQKVSRKIAREGSSIEIVGFTNDPCHYLSLSKLLVLPIQEPHFCRPAIEAGLVGRTFVVSKLRDLSDFARDNHNCKMCESVSNAETWADLCHQILSDDIERKRLEDGNKVFADDFANPMTFKDCVDAFVTKIKNSVLPARQPDCGE